ncbi:MAG: thermonuclease family protein [Phycisphaerae bacterium]|nr:thermonuclease family protein [Phycisphaerae bacterium]
MSNLKTAFVVACIYTSFSLAQTYDQVGTRKRDMKNYGTAIVSKVYDGEEVYSFRCDVKGWPAIIGEDVPVRIAGLELPYIVAEQPAPNQFFERQTIRFLNDFLKDAKTMELKNIRRGKDFCLVADVIADSNSVAEALIEKGFAKKADNSNPKIKPNIKKVIEIKATAPKNIIWVASKNSKVFHRSTCTFAKRMKKGTAIQFPTREKAIETGRRPCKTCKP